MPLDEEKQQDYIQKLNAEIKSIEERIGLSTKLLHRLLHKNPSVEEVQALIDKYPHTLREKDEIGWLPLHFAVSNGTSAEVVQLLIKEYPDALKEKDDEGGLPLHVAATHQKEKFVWEDVTAANVNADVKEVKELEEKRQKLHSYLALEEITADGNTKIQPEIKQLLKDAYKNYAEENPEDPNRCNEEIQFDAMESFTPKYSFTDRLILLQPGMKKRLKEAQEELLKVAREMEIPVKTSSRKGASVEVIQLLTKEYPGAAKEKNNFGNLPLHIAIKGGASAEVIQLIIKAYPDAVKEKDPDRELPLDNPQIKEIYGRAITVVQDLVRGEGLLGDHAKGKDLLGVKEEAQAIADTIAFKDLQTPFVVGILGGWGSGKSFTFHLIEEHLKEIQKYNLATEVIKLNSPYVGHIYLIRFDVWTFAKGCLWSSLMNRILTELNDQLDLEVAIGPELLMEGVSVIELMDQFTTKGEIEYLKEALKGKRVKEAIRNWEPRGGNITKALINATNSNYEKEVKHLEEKKQQLVEITVKTKQKLAWDDVTADVNTTFLPEIKQLLIDAYDQYKKDNPNDPIPQTVDDAMNKLERWKGRYGWLKKRWDLLRAGRLSPLWLAVFLSSLILAVILPVFLKSFEAIAIAFGPFVSGISGIFLRLNDAREKLRTAQAEIARVASEMHLDKEQLKNAVKAANKAQLRRDENDEEMQQDPIRDLNAEINSLQERIWLRKGDSLSKVVADRLGSNNYEDHLGVVHQAQKDLQRVSDAMLRRDDNEKDAAEKIFPRGKPRIVLLIDDLDRCTPKKVVETLEAVQLLVKTELFVVVLAIDAQYVTLCLEKEYENILHHEQPPSGLDYIEKIVQLPYRVPPISADYMESYLQEQMNPEDENDDIPQLSADNDDRVTQEELSSGDDDNQSSGQPNVKAPTGQICSQLLEAQMNCCEDDDTRELSSHISRPLKQEEKLEEYLNADKDTREFFRGNELPSAKGSDEPKSPEPNNDQSLGQPNVKTPILHEDMNMTSGTTNTSNVNLSEETPAQSESKEPLVAIPTKVLKFTRTELQSLKDACVLTGVGPRSAKRLVNDFKLMKIIWHRRDQVGVAQKEACVWILALCASSSKSVRREMCKVLARIEKTKGMPACGNLKDFIKKALGEMEMGSEQVDGSPLTMIYDEQCNKIFEEVKWKNGIEWNLVKKDLRLLRSFSFVGEYNEVVDNGRLHHGVKESELLAVDNIWGKKSS